jgi:hypothetical protein
MRDPDAELRNMISDLNQSDRDMLMRFLGFGHPVQDADERLIERLDLSLQIKRVLVERTCRPN